MLGAVALTAAAAVAVTATGLGSASPSAAADRCPASTRTLTVAASAEIAPAITDVARTAARADATDGGSCWRAQVQVRDPAEVAAALATTGAAAPDVWVPDSSLWPQPVTTDLASTPQPWPSIARSPLVLALDAPLARRAGWPARPLDLARLLLGGAGRTAAPTRTTPATTETSITIGLPDPRGSAPAMGVLAALRSTLGADPTGLAALAAALRAAALGLPTAPDRLLHELPDGPAVALPVTEQAVARHNAGRSQPAAVAAYRGLGGAALDYPYVTLTRDPRLAPPAARLLAALRSPAGQAALQEHGFRDPAGRPGPAITPTAGVDPGAPATRTPRRDEVATVLRTLDALTRDLRTLAVIDVSGSMGERVPGTQSTRLALTADAAVRGLALFPDSTAVGLWVFSTGLTPTTDYRELAPIAPLAGSTASGARRQDLARTLTRLRHVRGGGTALYDTALAAVRRVRQGWDPTRVNSVVLLTDGRNDDSRGITLPRLLELLRAEADSRRPVPVVTIAYGPSSDAAALAAISRATGGATYRAPDPRRVREVFLDAVGQRVCRPNC